MNLSRNGLLFCRHTCHFINNFVKQSQLSRIRSSPFPKYVRFYLSPAYSCQNLWDNRLKDPFIKDVKSLDYFYELIRKYKQDGKVSSIDADIFFNSISTANVEDLTDEIEELARLLRRSPETINTLPSTPHAIVRILLEGKKYDLILKFLSDPMNYGIFLDFYTANLLMDTFLQEKNFMAAARVASSHMLQEDFGPSLSQCLVMLSCFKYIFNPDENDVWQDFNPHVEPEEEVKIIVRYIRNPYFDDHFDLKEPFKIVGKTLAWLSFQIGEPHLKTSVELLGWALYEKWAHLVTAFETGIKWKLQIDEHVFNKIMERMDACPDEDVNKSKLLSLAEKAKRDLVSDLSLVNRIEEKVTELAKSAEERVIPEQEALYESWIVQRKEAVLKQLDLYENNRLIKEIEAKKNDLQRREDVIFFFENKNKFDLLTPRKRKYYPKKWSLIFHKKKPRTVDEEYVPPEV